MKRIGIYSLLVLLVDLRSLWSQSRNNYIYVGCMERAKNLNPYLAQSEIELALQQLVFPPLIADSGRKEKDATSFVRVLIEEKNILPVRNVNYVDFGIGYSRICPEITIKPGVIEENFRRLTQLAGGSNFSFNLAWADEQFGRKSILYLEVAAKGKSKGLDDMNMALMDEIRTQFKERLAEDSLLKKSGWIYSNEGLLNEDIQYNAADRPNPLKENRIKLFYIRNTINDRKVVPISSTISLDGG